MTEKVINMKFPMVESIIIEKIGQQRNFRAAQRSSERSLRQRPGGREHNKEYATNTVVSKGEQQRSMFHSTTLANKSSASKTTEDAINAGMSALQGASIANRQRQICNVQNNGRSVTNACRFGRTDSEWSDQYTSHLACVVGLVSSQQRRQDGVAV
jgi:hypothetical protein